MLELRHVTKRYPGTTAVKDVSFAARRGEVTGYLGPNGSGKSTTLKMITGLIEPTEGEILFDGERIERDPIAYRRRLGYVPEEPHLYPHLTGGEYLEMVGQLRGLPPRALAEKIDTLSAPALAPRRPLRSHLVVFEGHAPESAAGRRRCCTIPTWCCSTSLSPAWTSTPRSSCAALIAELAARGKTVLFSSHELETVERVSARVIILHKGRVVADDSIERLRVLMSLPNLEGIFAQLAVEQDTAGITRQFLECMEA